MVTSSSAARRLMDSPPPATEGVLEAVLGTSDDAILSLDASSCITSWNQSAERLFGHTAEAILGRSCTELFVPHLRDDVQAAVDMVMAGDRVSHLETEVQRADGMPMPISLSLCPVYDGGHDPVASVLIGRDITEQRLAQASLAEIEARVRDSEALANVGSWLWDLRTGTVQWSDEFHHIHGVEPLDFDGTWEGHLGSIHPEDREVVRTALEASVSSGRTFDHEYRIMRPGGDERLVHVRAQPMIGSDGAVVGLRGIGQDVTGRR